MSKSKFGKAPSGARLERIKKSPNYRNDKFQNLSLTPTFAEGYSGFRVLTNYLFKKMPDTRPTGKIPSQKTSLDSLKIEEDVMVWFGHSSYFIQVDKKRLIVDPVFSGNASPVPGTNRAFKGTDIYKAEEIPELDLLLITHDHWDHLDYDTVIKLQPKVKKVICPLGVGSHLEYWGFDPAGIIELDWYESADVGEGFTIVAAPTRHFSGRGLSRNITLWSSFVLQTPSMKIYIGGDSGYDSHYAETGKRFGPIDLAILDNGQYNPAWRYIHNLPEQVLQATNDLKARRLFPVHSCKFMLSDHPWYEPLRKITELNQTSRIPIITPLIGETVYLKNEQQEFRQWWKEKLGT